MISPEGPGVEPAAGASDSTGVHVDGARLGDREAFTTLYAKLAPSLYAWACLRIHASHRGRLDPEDVVQDVWWRALESIASYDRARGSFRSWIFTIANNSLLDGFRRLRTRSQGQGEDVRARRSSLPEQLADEATSISRQVRRDERVTQFLGAVDGLGEADRELFAYCALEGLEINLAARLLGVSEAAAAKRWQRLRARLRESPAFEGYLLEAD